MNNGIWSIEEYINMPYALVYEAICNKEKTLFYNEIYIRVHLNEKLRQIAEGVGIEMNLNEKLFDNVDRIVSIRYKVAHAIIHKNDVYLLIKYDFDRGSKSIAGIGKSLEEAEKTYIQLCNNKKFSGKRDVLAEIGISDNDLSQIFGMESRSLSYS